MKKILAVLLTAILVWTVCGCHKADDATETSSATPDNGQVSQIENDANADAAKPDENGVVYSNDLPNKDISQVIHELADGNLYVFQHITDLYGLPRSDKAVDGHYYEIQSDYFKSLSALENYLKSLYTADAVNGIMERIRGLYVEKNGKLYIDADLMKARGYFVQWSNYQLEIVKSDQNSCTFKITGLQIEPGENTAGVPYSTEGKAVKTDGKWRLTEMFH